jgi:16S rRNA (adenine1518-N6/adenine1519-N6)-dimethyltransferase
VIRGDALVKQRALNPAITARIEGRFFKLVANLPYQIASPLITTLLIDHPNCMGQFVTIQKEVADRLAAEPSSKAYGPLSVIVQALSEVRHIGTLSPSCFWPEPEVTSAMVAIAPIGAGRPRWGGREREFARFVTELFTKRRKQMGTIIGRSHSSWPQLAELGITAQMRPEALSVEQIFALWQHTG